MVSGPSIMTASEIEACRLRRKALNEASTKSAMKLQLDRERATRITDAKKAVLDAASELYDVYLNNEHDSLSMHAALTEFGLKMEVLREVQDA